MANIFCGCFVLPAQGVHKSVLVVTAHLYLKILKKDNKGDHKSEHEEVPLTKSCVVSSQHVSWLMGCYFFFICLKNFFITFHNNTKYQSNIRQGSTGGDKT